MGVREEVKTLKISYFSGNPHAMPYMLWDFNGERTFKLVPALEGIYSFNCNVQHLYLIDTDVIIEAFNEVMELISKELNGHC